MNRKDFLIKAGLFGVGISLMPSFVFGKDSLTNQKINLINRLVLYAKEQMGLSLRKDFFSKWSKNEDYHYYLYASEANKVSCPKGVNQYLFFGTDKINAELKQTEFVNKGLHTLIYKREGAHDFKITNSLLGYSNESIALLIFHEAAHQHFSKKAKLSLEIEESSCEVVGFYGARSYAKSFKEVDENKLNELIGVLEKAYSIINKVSSSISGDFSENEKLYRGLEEQLFSNLNINDTFVQQRFLYPVNNAYLLKNQFFSKRYELLKSVSEKEKTLNTFISTLEKLPKKDTKAIEHLIKKASNKS